MAPKRATDDITEDGWAALARVVKDLRERMHLTQDQFSARYGSSPDVISRIENRRSPRPSETTLRYLSLVFRKSEDYLWDVAHLRKVTDEPEPTLASLRDAISKTQETLDSMRTEVRGELRRQGDILHEIAPVVLGVEYKPIEHAVRDGAGVPARGKEPGENPLT